MYGRLVCRCSSTPLQASHASPQLASKLPTTEISTLGVCWRTNDSSWAPSAVRAEHTSPANGQQPRHLIALWPCPSAPGAGGSPKQLLHCRSTGNEGRRLSPPQAACN